MTDDIQPENTTGLVYFERQDRHCLRYLPWALAATHMVFFPIAVSLGKPGMRGTHPILCVDLPLAALLWSGDNSTTFVLVGMLATAWWYFIAEIGRVSKQGRMNRFLSGLGTILTVLVVTLDSAEMIRESLLATPRLSFSLPAILAYLLALLLLSGAVISATQSALGATGLKTC